MYSWYTNHSECQEAKGLCKYLKGCVNINFVPDDRIFFNTDGNQRSPRPHDTRYKYMKYSIENKKNMYFCNDVKRGETTVNQCHLLHNKKYFCSNTTSDNNTDDDTDDDIN